MAVCCKGICSRIGKKPAGSRPYYAGWKRCSICDMTFKTQSNRCPCCNFRLKTSPRQAKSKRKFLVVKGCRYA